MRRLRAGDLDDGAGTDLKPYGKDAAFQNECTGCHAPMAKNDFVYTMPIGGQQ